MKLSCPHCRGNIEVGEEWFGQPAECPHCGQAFMVPPAPPGYQSPSPTGHETPSSAVMPDRPAPPGDPSADITPRNAWKTVADGVSQVSGLEKLEGFSAQTLFSQVFSRHSPEEIEARLTAGTPETTPRLRDIQVAWPTPWVFCRIFALSLAGAITLYWALYHFQNLKLLPGWLFIGCFGIPFATLVFFFESNILRNVSYYRVQSVLILGGILSMIFSLILFDQTRLHEWIGAIAAGPIEEAGKLLAVVYFTRKWTRDHWTLNGLLFGAAVGTGFSAFESAGYVLEHFSLGGGSAAESTMVLRAFLSPFSHTIWTAAAAGALWRVKRASRFHLRMLFDLKFLRVFLVVVSLHALWNSPLKIPALGDAVGFYSLRILLGIIGWIIVFLLIQAGLKEVRDAQASLPPDPPEPLPEAVTGGA